MLIKENAKCKGVTDAWPEGKKRKGDQLRVNRESCRERGENPEASEKGVRPAGAQGIMKNFYARGSFIPVKGEKEGTAAKRSFQSRRGGKGQDRGKNSRQGERRRT